MDEARRRELGRLVLQGARDDNQRDSVKQLGWHDVDSDGPTQSVFAALDDQGLVAERVLVQLPEPNLVFAYGSADLARVELVWDARGRDGAICIPLQIADAETGEPLRLITFSTPCRWPVTLGERVFVDMSETRAHQDAARTLELLRKDPGWPERNTKTDEENLQELVQDTLGSGTPDLVSVTAGLMREIVQEMQADMRRDETIELLKRLIQSFAPGLAARMAMVSELELIDKTGAVIDGARWEELRSDLSYSRIRSHTTTCHAFPSVTIEWAVEWFGLRLPSGAANYVIASRVHTTDPSGATQWQLHGSFDHVDNAVKRLSVLVAECEGRPNEVSAMAQRLLARIRSEQPS